MGGVKGEGDREWGGVGWGRGRWGGEGRPVRQRGEGVKGGNLSGVMAGHGGVVRLGDNQSSSVTRVRRRRGEISLFR